MKRQKRILKNKNKIPYYSRTDIMSGPSRDRDAHRKWESGASKRRRKAEMAVTSGALSSSMRKFLNQNKSFSTIETTESETIIDS